MAKLPSEEKVNVCWWNKKKWDSCFVVVIKEEFWCVFCEAEEMTSEDVANCHA